MRLVPRRVTSPVQTVPCSTAIISDDGKYRYLLTRRWSDEPDIATFIMLNPSTADASLDDATITRCIGFAKAWGMGGLQVMNLYALRSTDPKGLWVAEDPVGPENNRYLSTLGAGPRVVRVSDVAGRSGWSTRPASSPHSATGR